MSAVLDLKSERVRERDVCGIRYRAKATQRPSLLLLFDTPNLIITRKRERSGRLMFRGIVPRRVVPVFPPLPSSSSSSLIPSLLHLLEFHRERITLHPRLHTHNSHSSPVDHPINHSNPSSVFTNKTMRKAVGRKTKRIVASAGSAPPIVPAGDGISAIASAAGAVASAPATASATPDTAAGFAAAPTTTASSFSEGVVAATSRVNEDVSRMDAAAPTLYMISADQEREEEAYKRAGKRAHSVTHAHTYILTYDSHQKKHKSTNISLPPPTLSTKEREREKKKKKRGAFYTISSPHFPTHVSSYLLTFPTLRALRRALHVIFFAVFIIFLIISLLLSIASPFPLDHAISVGR